MTEAYINFLNAFTAKCNDEELRKLMEESIEAWKSFTEWYKNAEITAECDKRRATELENHLYYTMHYYMDIYGARKNYERRSR